MFDSLSKNYSSNLSIEAESLLIESNLNQSWSNFLMNLMAVRESGYNRAFNAYLTEGQSGAMYIAEETAQKTGGFFAKIMAAIRSVLNWISEKAKGLFNYLKGLFSSNGGVSSEALKEAEDKAEAAGTKFIVWDTIKSNVAKALDSLPNFIAASKSIIDNLENIELKSSELSRAAKGDGTSSDSLNDIKAIESNSQVLIRLKSDLTIVGDQLSSNSISFGGNIDTLKAATAECAKWITTVNAQKLEAEKIADAIDDLTKKRGGISRESDKLDNMRDADLDELEKDRAKRMKSSGNKDEKKAENLRKQATEGASKYLTKGIAIAKDAVNIVAKFVGTIEKVSSKINEAYKRAKDKDRKKQDEKDTKMSVTAESFDMSWANSYDSPYLSEGSNVRFGLVDF